MNELKIYYCRDCIDWFPADTHGAGTHCGEINRTVHETEDSLIPDWCPRLSEQKEKVK